MSNQRYWEEKSAELMYATDAVTGLAVSGARAAADVLLPVPLDIVEKISRGEALTNHDRALIALGVVTSLAVKGPAENRIAGNAFRDEIALALRNAGRDVEIEVFKRTPFGPRYIDIEVSYNGVVDGGIETKLGGSRYHWHQRLKDWYLWRVENYRVNLVRGR